MLGVLFDVTDYDVASVLVPLAWWSRFHASSEQEGREREIYLLTLGAKMCENLGAINDETYIGHVRYARASNKLCVESLSSQRDHHCGPDCFLCEQ